MNKNELLRQLQMADFAIQEAALFLNSHPKDQSALDYYQKVQAYSAKLRKDYEAIYGPLSNRENQGDTWDYIHGNWPWEGGA